MDCAHCGTDLIAGKPFCPGCGRPAPLACPHCGAQVAEGFRFCPDCGGALSPVSGPPGQAALPERNAPPAPEFAALAKSLSFSEAPAGAGPVAERKQVTVLFCDLVGSTAIAERMDPEEYRDLLDGYLALALDAVNHMEGMVNQLAGDGFMALFGAPIAREDAPANAVQAALDIHRALERYAEEERARGIDLSARIGIHTGPVVVGNVGNDLKTDYTAIGDTTNLASRLQDMAGAGSTLISDATHALVEGQFEVRPTGPFEVAGRRGPVQAFEVVRPIASVSPIGLAVARGLTPLIGFEQELAQLEACHDRLAAGLPQLVSIIGDAGSGKSRLTYELKQRLLAKGDIVLEGRAAAITRSVPLAPLSQILRQLFELEQGESETCVCDKIRVKLEGVDDEGDDTYNAMCQLVLNAGARGEEPKEGLRAQVHMAVGKLLSHVSKQQPVVIIVEDLHWIDEASLEVLQSEITHDHRSRVMLIVTHRPDFRTEWNAVGSHTQLRLSPFDEEQAVRMVRARAGGSLPPELEHRIVTQADGNPFYLEEMTRALVEQGHIVQEEGRIRLTRPVDEISIPGTVQELIGARLDRLSPQAKRAAQVAAVLGRQFRPDHLAALVEGEGIDVDSELAELERGGIVHRDTQGRDYRFGESLTQAVAYEGLLLKERRMLHERIGSLLESEVDGTTGERAALIAHHLARSENREKAIESLLRAARSAEEMPSYANAIELYREAWRQAEAALEEGGSTDKHRQALLQATLGVCGTAVLYTTTDHRDEERAAIRATEIANELGDRAALSRAQSLRGMLVMAAERERFPEGIQLIEGALRGAQEADLPYETASTQRALLWAYALDGQFERAQGLIEDTIAMLAREGHASPPSDLYVSTVLFRCMASLMAEDLGLALERGIEAYDLAIRAENRTVQGGASAHLARAHYLKGDYTEARDWAIKAVEIGHAIGSTASMRSGAAVELGARLALGQAPKATRFLETVDQSLETVADGASNGDIIIELLLELGETERAKRYEAGPLRRGGGRVREAMGALAHGHVERQRGASNWRPANQSYRRAIELAQEIPLPSVEASALLGAAGLALDRGHVDMAHKLASDARDVAVARGLGLYRDRADRLIADS